MTTTTEAANPLAITKERVKAWSACTDGYRWFLENFPQGGEFAEVYRALQDGKRYDDSEWLADRVFAELDAPTQVQQTVKIAGADRALIEKAAQDAGTEDGAATTGDRANAATTGDRANAATTGNRANAATTGDRANAATTGNWANAATTGNWANAATTGEGAIAAVFGANSKAKASAGGAIVLTWRADYPSKEFKVFSSKVGENGINPDIWYELNADGVPVEVDDE